MNHNLNVKSQEQHVSCKLPVVQRCPLISMHYNAHAQLDPNFNFVNIIICLQNMTNKDYYYYYYYYHYVHTFSL